MAFRDALQFPFRGERRWQNLGFAMLCFLIPIIGPIVLLGYGVLVEKTLIADLGAAAPDFDFNHFTAYLKRGIEPLVVGLIFIPILMIAILPVVALLVWGIISLKNEPLALGLVIGLAVLAELAMIALSNLLMTPIALKAGLERTIRGAFDWKFIVEFIKRAGWRMLVYNLLLMIISVLIMPFAFCCLVVGVYAVTAWLMFVQFHIRAQLYCLYLERGGRALDIRNDDHLNAFLPIMDEQQGR